MSGIFKVLDTIREIFQNMSFTIKRTLQKQKNQRQVRKILGRI